MRWGALIWAKAHLALVALLLQGGVVLLLLQLLKLRLLHMQLESRVRKQLGHPADQGSVSVRVLVAETPSQALKACSRLA
jgi:hypothetical protein